MGGIVFWIESEDSSSSNSVANLERKFTQERDRASVAIAGFTAAREPENVSLTKQRELKQALDESEARSKALARELAETKQHADARQIELQEALGSSENTVLALERELSSAREAVASAEGSSNAKVTTRDTTSPTGSLNRPMEGSNAVSEITGSMPTPQDRGNVTAGVQTSSDATLDDVAAGASGAGILSEAIALPLSSSVDASLTPMLTSYLGSGRLVNFSDRRAWQLRRQRGGAAL
jgi:hypothetical protein